MNQCTSESILDCYISVSMDKSDVYIGTIGMTDVAFIVHCTAIKIEKY